MNKPTLRSSILLFGLTVALLGTVFASTIADIIDPPRPEATTSLASEPEWSVFLAP